MLNTVRGFFGLLWMPALVAGAQTPPAAAAPSYAVVSEVGQQLQVVGFKEQTGTRLDSNLRSRINLTGGALDKVALLATQRALNRAAPGAPVFMVSPLDVELFSAIGNPVVGQMLQLPADLAAALKQQGSTRLPLINRREADTNFQALDNRLGSGRITGPGFYVERTTVIRNVDKGESAQGFLPTFAYLNLSPVDLRDGRVLATQPVTDSRLDIAPVSTDSGHPWDSVSNDYKMANLQLLVRVAVEQTVPVLLNVKP
ncbi:MAG: hypothetical protein ABIN96_00310 [Rubrivivax sp.]